MTPQWRNIEEIRIYSAVKPLFLVLINISIQYILCKFWDYILKSTIYRINNFS